MSKYKSIKGTLTKEWIEINSELIKSVINKQIEETDPSYVKIITRNRGIESIEVQRERVTRLFNYPCCSRVL